MSVPVFLLPKCHLLTEPFLSSVPSSIDADSITGMYMTAGWSQKGKWDHLIAPKPFLLRFRQCLLSQTYCLLFLVIIHFSFSSLITKKLPLMTQGLLSNIKKEKRLPQRNLNCTLTERPRFCLAEQEGWGKEYDFRNTKDSCEFKLWFTLVMYRIFLLQGS